MKNKIISLILILVFSFSLNLSLFALEDEIDESNNETVKEELNDDNSENTETNEVEETSSNSFNYKNPTTNYELIIEDDANLFSSSEIYKLKTNMIELTQYGNIALKTINKNSTTPESFASSYYHKLFGKQSGTLFLIDMDNRYLYIFSDGSNYKIITKNNANTITDNVYRYAKNGNYYSCADEAFIQIGQLLKGSKIAQPMKYTSNALIAIILSAFINFFIIVNISRLKKSNDKGMLENCKINFDIKEITGTKTGVHSEYRPISDSSSSGGGSSGGGGSGGGGGSSGGGGGHGF